MYAIKNDQKSFRAIGSIDDLLDNETYSVELPVLPAAVKTTEEMAEEAMTERDRLLTLAALRIAPLQDVVDLNKAVASDVVKLNLWKQYRVDVNRINEQEDFPEIVIWPDEPN